MFSLLRQLHHILHHPGHQLLEYLGVFRRDHRPTGLQLLPGIVGDADLLIFKKLDLVTALFSSMVCIFWLIGFILPHSAL